MADVTGGPVVTNASPFAVPADLTALKDHFGAAGMFSVANAAALPASGNWAGRLLTTADTGSLYRHNGTSWEAILSRGWTTYTTTITGMSVGSGTVDFKSRFDGALVHVIGTIVIGAGGSVTSSPRFTLPVSSVAPAHPFATLCGVVSLYDVSAGTPRDAYVRASTSSTTVVDIVGGNASTPITITTTAPFTWAAPDVLHVQFSYEPA